MTPAMPVAVMVSARPANARQQDRRQPRRGERAGMDLGERAEVVHRLLGSDRVHVGAHEALHPRRVRPPCAEGTSSRGRETGAARSRPARRAGWRGRTGARRPTTPTIVTHCISPGSRPSTPIRRPIGSSPGQKRRAIDWLTTADSGGVLAVGGLEAAALQDRNADRLEVIGADALEIRARQRLGGDRRLALDPEPPVGRAAARSGGSCRPAPPRARRAPPGAARAGSSWNARCSSSVL